MPKYLLEICTASFCIAFGAFVFGYDKGMNKAESQNQKELIERLELIQQNQQQIFAFTSDIESYIVVHNTKQSVKYSHLQQKDNSYALKHAHDKCNFLDPEWVRLHNSAIPMSSISKSTSLTLAESAGIAKAVALENDRINYQICAQAIFNNKEWQKWYFGMESINARFIAN